MLGTSEHHWLPVQYDQKQIYYLHSRRGTLQTAYIFMHGILEQIRLFKAIMCKKKRSKMKGEYDKDSPHLAIIQHLKYYIYIHTHIQQPIQYGILQFKVFKQVTQYICLTMYTIHSPHVSETRRV